MPPLRICLVPLVLGLFGAGCSDRVVDSRAYNEEGRIVWSTVMPASRNMAVWLRYSINGPVSRNATEDEGSVAYDLSGHLWFTVDGGQRYVGGVYLKPEGVAVDKVYSKGERDGVTRTCGYSTCLENGRIKLLTLQDVPAGARLEFEGFLPLTNGGAELVRANLELAPN